MGRLEGVRVIVTGAGSGIGRAVLRRYRQEGARVVAVVRDANEVTVLEDEGVAVVVGDVAQYGTAERSVAMALKLFGGLDVYVANAGIWDFRKRIEEQSERELTLAYHEIFGVNFLGTLFGARAAVAALRESRGSIIATGSNASFLAGGGGALYTASKFALRGLIMQLATEFAPDVRVNGVAPGATDTGLSGPEALQQGEQHLNADPGRMDAIRSRMRMGRISHPEDHASLYVLLAAKAESGYVNGAMLRSDGGATISI